MLIKISDNSYIQSTKWVSLFFPTSELMTLNCLTYALYLLFSVEVHLHPWERGAWHGGFRIKLQILSHYSHWKVRSMSFPFVFCLFLYHSLFFGLTVWPVGSSFPTQGSNPCLLQEKHRVLTTGLSGKSQCPLPSNEGQHRIASTSKTQREWYSEARLEKATLWFLGTLTFEMLPLRSPRKPGPHGNALCVYFHQ